jgi:hypothetical protein
MSLAGIGLMRSVGNGVAVAGNMALKQATTAAAEQGVAAAMDYLDSLSGAARKNDIGTSYYASYKPGGVVFDPVGVGHAWWKSNAAVVSVAGTDYEGMDIRYVIHRLCEANGDVDDTCIRMGVAQKSKFHAPCGVQGGVPLPCDETKYAGFRITTRVVGPKNSVSYVEVVVF